MRPILRVAALTGCLLIAARGAQAWSSGGHMVTAAIAYDDLKARDPAALKRLIDILERHPDKAAFQVAAGDLAGEAHDLALFEECARWPDDARGTNYDHPTWHYAFEPLVVGAVAAPPEAAAIEGDAEQALILIARVLGNPAAPPTDRAVALCWVMHIVADMHQPLHAARLVSPAFPNGDHGGATESVRDPETGKMISLHWLWDQAIARSVAPVDVSRTASTLEAGSTGKPSYPLTAEALFQTAAAESYALARADAYTAEVAPVFTPSPTYIARMERVASDRAGLAGHRLAALLTAIVAKP